MRALKPLCPVCRSRGGESVLEIGLAAKETEDFLGEGILVCSNAKCRSEFPVIDGIPVILPNLREYISQNIMPIMARSDLSGAVESLLGDCAGDGSAFDFCRRHVGTYACSHYEDLHPGMPNRVPESAGSAVRLLERGMGLLGGGGIAGSGPGPVLDVGCSVGRASFELARKFAGPVLGIDLNFSMLKTAAAVLRSGTVVYPRRREGLVYDQVSFPVDLAGPGRADFWACDAAALPFAGETFSLAVSLNVVDCVWSPFHHLQELSRVLRPGAAAVVSTPYDWTSGATPIEAWMGGHSQRSEHRGSGASVLRAFLESGDSPADIQRLEIESEEDAEWTLRLHDRSYMKYVTHLMVLRKKAP